MKKLAIVGASAALAALPVLGVFAADTSVTDTIKITVNDACTITESSTTDGLDNKDTTYADTVANGAETTFSGTHSGNHQLHVSCNAASGWKLTVTPNDLTGYTDSGKGTTNGDTISYTSSYAASGTAGLWTAIITAPSGITVTQASTAGSGNIVISEQNAQAANVEITSTYKAYVGTQTSAGYYEGDITYLLSAI